MPEAFAIFAVFAVVAAAFVGARQNGTRPADKRQEIERLKHQELWLQQRLERARRENWGGDMIAAFTRDLEATSRQLAEVAGPAA
jgi:hypothetical protein